MTIDASAIIKRYGPKCYSLISQLLSIDPQARPTAKKALEHEFLNMMPASKEDFRSTST